MPGANFDSTFTSNPNLDPLQGFDIKVTTLSGGLTAGTRSAAGVGAAGHALVGAFTSAMFKVVNQTETYLPLNSRLPKHLDGEIIIVYALEQGMVSPDVLTNSYGSAVADQLKLGRGYKVPRMQRFDIKFEANLSKDLGTNGAQDPSIFYNNNFGTTNSDTAGTQSKDSLVFTLHQCRVDTFSFGMTAGRHVVANSWQGTAESLQVLLATNTSGQEIDTTNTSIG